MTNLQIYRGWVFVHLKIKKSYELVNNILSLEKIHLCMYKKVFGGTRDEVCAGQTHAQVHAVCSSHNTPSYHTHTHVHKRVMHQAHTHLLMLKHIK